MMTVNNYYTLSNTSNTASRTVSERSPRSQSGVVA